MSAAAPSRDSLLDVLLEFLEAVVHQILFVRELYSPELFERQRLYGIAVRRSRHPELNAYVADAVAGLRVRLQWHSASGLWHVAACNFYSRRVELAVDRLQEAPAEASAGVCALPPRAGAAGQRYTGQGGSRGAAGRPLAGRALCVRATGARGHGACQRRPRISLAACGMVVTLSSWAICLRLLVWRTLVTL